MVINGVYSARLIEMGVSLEGLMLFLVLQKLQYQGDVVNTKDLYKELAFLNLESTKTNKLLMELSEKNIIEYYRQGSEIKFNILRKASLLYNPLEEVVIKKEKEKVEKSTDEVEKVLGKYKELQDLLPKFKNITPKRIIAIKKAVKQFGEETVIKYLEYMSKNNFYLDKLNEGWYNLDWIFKIEKMTKNIERMEIDNKEVVVERTVKKIVMI